MLSANTSWVGPTRMEWPLTPFVSSGVMPTHSTTRLNVCAIASTLSRGFTPLPRLVRLRTTNQHATAAICLI
jgi:hypothetical protein